MIENEPPPTSPHDEDRALSPDAPPRVVVRRTSELRFPDSSHEEVIDELPETVHVGAVDRTRNFLAIAISIGFLLTTVLVVVGGLIGRFPPEMVAAVMTALAASAGSVAYFYFRRRG